MKKYDVFISYSRKDYVDENDNVIPGNIVTKIRELFDTNGISYWFDEQGIYSGDEFAGLIAKNIKESRLLLFISSEHSNISPWTSSEIATARAYKKKIIPFRYDDSEFNESVMIYIANLDYIDYLKNKAKAFQKLLTSVQSYIKAENEQKELEKREAERLRLEEISLQEKNEKLRALKTKLVLLENRKLEIKQELLECEKTQEALQTDLRVTDINISELREQINTLVKPKSDETKGEKESGDKLTTSDWVLIGVGSLLSMFIFYICPLILLLINGVCGLLKKPKLVKPKVVKWLFIIATICIFCIGLLFGPESI